MRKQTVAVFDRHRQSTHGRRHGAKSKTIIKPQVLCIAVEDAFAGESIELMDLADFGNLEFQRRAPLQHRLDILLEEMLRIYICHSAAISALRMVEIPRAR